MFAEHHFCLPNFFGKLSRMTNAPEPALKRFGDIVRERRQALRLSQEDVTARGGPSDTTLTKIENVEWNPTRPNETLRKLDVGLGWEPGSARRVLDGGEPALVDGVVAVDERGEEFFEIGQRWDTMTLRDGRVMPVTPGMMDQANEARAMLANPNVPLDPSIRDILQGLVDHLDLATLQERISRLDHDQLVKLSNYVDTLLYEGNEQHEEVTQPRTSSPSTVDRGAGRSKSNTGAPNTRAANGGADKVTPLTRPNQGLNPDGMPPFDPAKGLAAYEVPDDEASMRPPEPRPEDDSQDPDDHHS